MGMLSSGTLVNPHLPDIREVYRRTRLACPGIQLCTYISTKATRTGSVKSALTHPCSEVEGLLRVLPDDCDTH